MRGTRDVPEAGCAPDAVPHVLHVPALPDALQDWGQVLPGREQQSLRGSGSGCPGTGCGAPRLLSTFEAAPQLQGAAAKLLYRTRSKYAMSLSSCRHSTVRTSSPSATLNTRKRGAQRTRQPSFSNERGHRRRATLAAPTLPLPSPCPVKQLHHESATIVGGGRSAGSAGRGGSNTARLSTSRGVCRQEPTTRSSRMRFQLVPSSWR